MTAGEKRDRRRRLPRRGASARPTATPRSPPSRARGLPLLLPAALPARQRDGGARPAAEPAPRAPRRSWARCSRPRTAGSAPTTSTRGSPGGGAGEDQRAFGWSAPPSQPLLARGARGVPRARRHHRPDARSARSRSRARARSRCSSASATTASTAPVGRVVYTQFLNTRGGIVADLTVTRLAEDRFRIVTGAGAIDSDLGWLELHREPATAGDAARRDRRARGDRDLGAARARRARRA